MSADIQRRVRRLKLVRAGFTQKADDVPQCQHGVPMRRCDDCGAWLAAHPGAVPHVCGERRASCADDERHGAA